MIKMSAQAERSLRRPCRGVLCRLNVETSDNEGGLLWEMNTCICRVGYIRFIGQSRRAAVDANEKILGSVEQ